MTDQFEKMFIAHFNKAAKTYQLAKELPEAIANNILARLEYIKGEKKTILNLSYDIGFSANNLEKLYPKAKIINIYHANAFLKQAKKSKRKLFSKQSFMLTEAENLPFKDNSIDFIYSNLMLHWFVNQQTVLKEWQRVLRPEGLLMFTTFGPDTLKELRASFAKFDEFAHVHPFFDMHDIGDNVLKSGFKDPVLDVAYITQGFKQVKHLMQELKNLGWQNALANRRHTLTGKHRFNNVCNYYQQNFSENRKIIASYEVVYAHAWGSDINLTQQVPSEISIPIKKIIRS